MIGDPLLRGSFFICGNARKKSLMEQRICNENSFEVLHLKFVQNEFLKSLHRQKSTIEYCSLHKVMKNRHFGLVKLCKTHYTEHA